MDLAGVEENVANLDVSQGFDLIFDLLLAYGTPRSSIARLRSGSTNQSDREHEVLLKTKVYYRFVPEDADGIDLHEVIDGAASESRITKQRPRFLIVQDSTRLLAVDTKTGQTLDIELERLGANASFFLPWAGMEKAQLESLHYADVKAAEKMARLYDEIQRRNEISDEAGLHALNVFFTRLLFCFFAEDTGIFEKGQVTQAIGSLTREDGEDTHAFLDELFVVLDTPSSRRTTLPSYLDAFGYVNGSLFSRRSRVPHFSAKARSIVLECGELDWSEINPDIFGSMMQAVVHKDQRSGLGMHYTSVENIMRVLRPLFLDDLEAAYEIAADDPKKLRKLMDRLSSIKVFDPACGSGNFLVIAYKELRRLEHRIFERLRELNDDPLGSGLFKESGVKLDHFYGIEIDDFAHEVARLGLWLAKHQMNTQFEQLFGPRLQMIPLTDTGQITCDNAARLDWQDFCWPEQSEQVYVCGNPPYLGYTMQTLAQKSDFAHYFGDVEFPSTLDYISLWFLKGADYVASTGAILGFVATNSICQGDHVALLFPSLFERGAEIAFAHTSFKWTNSARDRAGVTCIILGLSKPSENKKILFTDGSRRLVSHIGPYLRAGDHDTVVRRSTNSIAGLPEMIKGSQPTDAHHLTLTTEERNVLLASYPEAGKFIRRYMGADEFLYSRERYCIWVTAEQADEAAAIPPLAKRFEAVSDFRAGGGVNAKKVANVPYRFQYPVHRDDASAVIVPLHSSESREYVPMGFLGPDTVISNAANAIYGAEPWLFGLVQSRMHMVWLRAVGGQLETRLRYSATLVYNTFPAADLSDPVRETLSAAGLRVLSVREQFFDQTLAALYDAEKMPQILREAHRRLDEAVDQIYYGHEFDSNDTRLASLFEMYEKLTTPRQVLLNA